MTDPALTGDVVIVGAGSAGSVLASRLCQNPAVQVILVEAGNEPVDPRIADPAAWPFLQDSAIDWAFRTVPQAHMAGRVHPCPRGRVIGGSSAINAMGHMRGDPADFDGWERAGATGWNWATLHPFFQRSETSPFAGEDGYGGDGPLTLCQPATPHPLTRCHIAAGQELGLTPIRDHNGKGMAGPTLNTMTIRNGDRLSVADAYLTATVRTRANLQIVTDVLVDRLAFAEDGRVTGIQGQRGGAPLTIIARKTVILSAGTIGSPAILMRSGIGPAENLRALGIPVRQNLPGVGANLQDHLLAAGCVYRARRPVPPTTTQHSESLTYIRSHPGHPPDLVVGVVSVPVLSDGLAGLTDAPGPGEGYAILFGITHPQSRGQLSLNSADPRVHPLIDPRYLSDPTDRAQFVQALDWGCRIGAARAYDAWRGNTVFPRPEDLTTTAAKESFVARAATTHHHPIGTCRMGSDAMAVVRPDLSVAGHPGLAIVDGSILPALTTGPVNAAIVAVAERAAMLLG